jgi:hypothetical protein
MSNYLAIATVTAALYDILSQNAQEAVPGARVTLDRPSDMENDRSGRPRINLYLYQTVPNAAWRNADLPTRRSSGPGNGGVISTPQAALNLYYLLTFFGDETQFVPQRLLGKTVSLLHSRPRLGREEINGAVRGLVEAGQEYMADSNLADQVEQVKFTPVSMDLDELSGFWSALYQVPYSLSLMYEASVVLIESPETPQPVLPVLRPNIQVLPFTHSVIQEVVPQEPGMGRIYKDATVLLRGRQLAGNIAYVALGQAQLTPQRATNSEVRVVITGESLYAGAQGIRIVYHDRVDSNAAPLVLHPKVWSAAYAPPGQEGAQGVVALETDVIIRAGQRVVLLLNQLSSDSAEAGTPVSRSASVVATPPMAETRTIVVPLADPLPSGSRHLVRLQIDGAESPLEVDANPDSPTFNQYIGPTLEVP